MDFVVPAFIAGLLTFIAPCTLPLLPAYVSLISGLSSRELADATTVRAARRRIFLNGLCFMAGFTLVFVFFGTLAGLFGAALSPLRISLTRLGGVLVALFGLFMLGLVKIPALNAGGRLRLPFALKRGSPIGSAAIGASLAFGWSPCVGPILASILLFASQSGTAREGALLLLVFSAGLSLPFLLVAATVGSASAWIAAFASVLTRFRVLILAIAGILIGFLGNVALFALGLEIGRSRGVSFWLTHALAWPFREASYLLPTATAALLGFHSYREREIDVIATIDGFFLLLLGILLATGNFAILTQYTYDVFRVFNYERLFEYL